MMKTYRPTFRVTVRDLATNTEKCDLTGSITTLVTAKAFGRCFGTWQITLISKPIYGQSPDQFLVPNDVVQIELDGGSGDGLVPVMLGLVDRVARNFSSTPDGKPVRSVVVSGRDMGKLFTGELGWDISGLNAQTVYGLDNIQSSILRRYSLATGTPKYLVRELFNIWSSQVQGQRYQRYVAADWVGTDDSWQTYSPTLVGVRGTSFWEACQRASNSPWNVLFCDTDTDGKFHLGLVPTPYEDDGRLGQVTRHQVADGEIASEDLGKSDVERVNLLCHWPPNQQLLANGQIEIALADSALTKFDADSIATNGVSAHVIEPVFVPKNFYLADTAMIDDSDSAADRAQKYWGWFSNNHTYETGTVEIHLRPEIRAGDGVQLVGASMEYQVQQVVHHVDFPAMTYRTNLALIRGQSYRQPGKRRPVQNIIT